MLGQRVPFFWHCANFLENNSITEGFSFEFFDVFHKEKLFSNLEVSRFCFPTLFNFFEYFNPIFVKTISQFMKSQPHSWRKLFFCSSSHLLFLMIVLMCSQIKKISNKLYGKSLVVFAEWRKNLF